ncbi:MAG: hypothetical protein V8Q76_13075 [Bacteroides intestinalis]
MPVCWGVDRQCNFPDTRTEEKIRKEISRLFDGMMEALYKEKGAQFRIELLEKPQTQEFIEGHSSALNSSFNQVEMSDIMRRRLEPAN